MLLNVRLFTSNVLTTYVVFYCLRDYFLVFPGATFNIVHIDIIVKSISVCSQNVVLLAQGNIKNALQCVCFMKPRYQLKYSKKRAKIKKDLNSLKDINVYEHKKLQRTLKFPSLFSLFIKQSFFHSIT